MIRGIAIRKRMAKGGSLGIVLAIALAALLLVTACGPGGSPVEQGKVVEIGMLVSMTGATAEAEQAAFYAIEDGLRWWNEERGIPGVTIKHIWRDNARDTGKILSTYRAFVERGVPAFVNFSPPGALKAKIDRDQIPLLCEAITGEAMYPPGWVYSDYPTEAERFAAMADWIMENWSEDRPPKIAFVVPDVEYAREPLGACKKYAESIGMEWLPPEFIPYVPLDSTPQLLRLGASGADFVYIGPLWPTALPVLRDAERLGLIDQMNFCLWDAALVDKLIEILGPATEGLFGPHARPVPNEVDNPGVQWAMEVWERYHGTEEMNPLFVFGVSHSPILPDAIKMAIEKVGYENLDGQAVREALDTYKDYDPYGYGAPLDYTDPENHRGSPWVRIYQIQGGKQVGVSEWKEAPVLLPVAYE
jgi:branched-chain amino acid transport system substrate-binding protein